MTSRPTQATQVPPGAMTTKDKDEVPGLVAEQVVKWRATGQIDLPPDYSAVNACKAALIRLEQITDRSGRCVLDICTKHSIAQSLIDMVLQGLDPEKQQCWFIAYGTRLACQRSYFGTIHLAKRLTGCEDPFAEVVYEGDEFEYEIGPRQKWVKTHRQKLANVKRDQIKAVYCILYWKQVGNEPARPDYTEIMTWEQVQQAWKHSQTYKGDATSSPHTMHPEEMAKRTVIARACKRLINSTSDKTLFVEAFNRASEQADEEAAQAAIEEGTTRLLPEREPQSFDETDKGVVATAQVGGQEGEPPPQQEKPVTQPRQQRAPFLQ